MSAEKLLLIHKTLSIPDFSDDDSLSNWIEDLIEVDMYYVGLASSSIGATNMGVDVDELRRLSKSLNRLRFVTSDKSGFKDCEQYLKSLTKLVHSMNE